MPCWRVTMSRSRLERGQAPTLAKKRRGDISQVSRGPRRSFATGAAKWITSLECPLNMMNSGDMEGFPELPEKDLKREWK